MFPVEDDKMNKKVKFTMEPVEAAVRKVTTESKLHSVKDDTRNHGHHGARTRCNLHSFFF